MPKLPRLPKKDQDSKVFNPDRGPVISPRFLLALLLFVGGIAWIAYYYVGVRPQEGFGSDGTPNVNPKTFEPYAVTGWDFMGDLKGWNYLIGFAAIMLGLAVSAHKSTPMGRGRGVVIGMLGCFVLGIIWICTYYVVGTNLELQDKVPVFNDLQQKNLIVGIAFMAVGFTFATRWE